MHRVWRIADPAVREAVASELADAELLIADGHHRYETALAYADEIGGEGPHRYTLMCLVSLEDPGLTIFGTHRMLGDLDADARERLGHGIREHFQVEEAGEDDLDPAGSHGHRRLRLPRRPLRPGACASGSRTPRRSTRRSATARRPTDGSTP